MVTMTNVMFNPLERAYDNRQFTGIRCPSMRIEIPQLPVAFMNEDHLHAASQIETMKTALSAYPHSREPLMLACRAFLEHNREHFAREEAAMQTTRFPPFSVHKGEHERVLRWLEGLVADIEAGLDIDAATQAVDCDIPAWFTLHIQTMDMATAAWVSTRETTQA